MDTKKSSGATDSLAPVQLERLSVEEEVAQMQRGKGGKMALVIAAGSLLLAGGAYWMRHLDVERAYVVTAESIAQVDTQQAQAFMHCALRNVQAPQLASPDALRATIEITHQRLGAGFTRNLDQCLPLLDDLAPGLTAIKAPNDVKPKLTALEQSSNELRRSWKLYRTYLGDPKFDDAQAAQLIESVTAAWARYEDLRSKISDELTTKR